MAHVLKYATAAALLAAAPAHASHFRYGNIQWESLGGTDVNFTFQQGWRGTFFTFCADTGVFRGRGRSLFFYFPFYFYSGGSPCSGPSGQAITGDIIQPGSLSFGDGSSHSMYALVTSHSIEDDWVFAELIDYTALPDTRFGITHAYSTSGTYTAQLYGCCRIGSPLVNNAHGNYIVKSTVPVGTSNFESPTALVPPTVSCGLNEICTFNVPASDPDGVTYRLAGSSDAGSFSHPSGATVDSVTGLYTFDTSGTSDGQLYSTQVVIEDGAGASTAVDFMIDIVDDPTDPADFSGSDPVCDTTQPAYVGSELTFMLMGSDPDGTDVELNVLGLPSGALLTPGLPQFDASVATTFSWTPTQGDVGSTVVTFTLSSGGTIVQCPVVVDVTGEDPGTTTTTTTTTTTEAPVYQDQIGQCDGTAFCTIMTYHDCVEGLYALGYDQLPHLSSPLEVNNQTNSKKVAGCSSRNKALGTFVFNDLFSSTAVHKSAKDKRVICKKCPAAVEFELQDFACDGERYCVIEDQATCENAGAMLGYPDTSPRVGSWTNKNAGCSITRNSGIRFNTNLASTYVHSNTNRQAVCQICDGRDKYLGATISPCTTGSPCP